MKRKTLYILVSGSILVLLLLALAKRQGFIGGDNSLRVATASVESRTIVETVTANGRIQPEVELIITPDVSGEIVELFVDEGESVKKGQSLARINPENYLSYLEQMEAGMNAQRANLANSRARMMQAEAQLLNSTNEYNRIKSLHKKGAISDSEMESTKTAFKVASADLEAAKQSVQAAKFSVKSAEASLKEAKQNLMKTTLVAPMDGTVSRLSKKQGERVVGTSQFEGTEIMRIADLTNMEVNVEVSENDIVRVKLNDTAIVEVDAYSNRKFKGVVTRIANSASISGFTTDQVTNFEVKIKLLRSSYEDLIPEGNPDGSPFRPGMSANVDIQTAVSENSLAIPIEAVTRRSDTVSRRIDIYRSRSDEDIQEAADTSSSQDVMKQYVFVYKNDVVRIREVKTGIQDTEYMQIIDGLKEDEEVVVAPYSAVSRDLSSGDSVRKVGRNELFM